MTLCLSVPRCLAIMLSVVAGMRAYIQSMVDAVSGMKVLLLDPETLGIISMVFSQSEILENEVFLVERIDKKVGERMKHLKAICFLRPTNQNFIFLSQELKAPRYNEYHIFFTNVVLQTRLEQLAGCDEGDVVHQVQENYADVYAVNHDLFSLNLLSTIRLHENQSQWSSYEESIFERIIEGLLSVCIALRLYPCVRYTSCSELGRQVAQRLQQRILEEQSLFEAIERESKGEPPPVLLFLDRRNDPVTPLLNQWTYQAMLHELLTLDNNRVDLSAKASAGGTTDPAMSQIVMSSTQDVFFEENMLSNFGDLGGNVRNYVEQYQQATKNTAKIESLEDMQQFVDKYPEFRRMSGNVSKHVGAVHELSHIVDSTGLLMASQLEQELACEENRQEHFRQVSDMLLGSNVTNIERLRLVCLYALRYEHEVTTAQLKDILKGAGVDERQVSLVDLLLRHAGAHVRSGDLFQNKTFLAQAKSSLTKGFKGVENVYTQHKTLLASIADMMIRGRLKDANFPFAEGCRNVSNEPPRRAVVFVIGGATFEEARDIAELNKTSGESGCTIVLGGTAIHNSRSFLADIAQLGVVQPLE